MELKERINTLFKKYAVNLNASEQNTEDKPAEEAVKFMVEGKLKDGTMIYSDAEEWVPGVNIYILNEEEEKIAVPTGEYELEDGTIVAVTEGVVDAIKPVEEEVEEEPAEEVEASQDYTKEDVLNLIEKAVDALRTEFSTQLKAKDKEIETLKAEFNHQGLPKAVAPKKQLNKEDFLKMSTNQRISALYQKYN